MKRTLLVVSAVMVLLGYSVVAMAASVSTNVSLSLAIAGDFGFILDKYSYNFDTATVNLQTTVGIFCRSNNGKVWYMDLSANPFTLTGGVETIPNNPNFTCAAWSNPDDEQAQGSFGDYGIEGGQPVPTNPDTFYTSHADEGSDPMVPLSLGLYLTIPDGQTVGLYETDLILTMHE